MGSYAMEFPLPILFILSLSIFHATAQFIPLLGDPCANVACGKGSCKVNSSVLVLGYDCVCDSGWTKIEVVPGLMTPCILPNSCNLVWCGDGDCVVNGTTHYCHCNDGSDNIFNATALPCFKKELECGGVRLGQDSPPGSGEGSDQNHNSPQGNGSNGRMVPKFSWSNGALTPFMLITIFLLFL